MWFGFDVVDVVVIVDGILGVVDVVVDVFTGNRKEFVTVIEQYNFVVVDVVDEQRSIILSKFSLFCCCC